MNYNYNIIKKFSKRYIFSFKKKKKKKKINKKKKKIKKIKKN